MLQVATAVLPIIGGAVRHPLVLIVLLLRLLQLRLLLDLLPILDARRHAVLLWPPVVAGPHVELLLRRVWHFVSGVVGVAIRCCVDGGSRGVARVGLVVALG